MLSLHEKRKIPVQICSSILDDFSGSAPPIDLAPSNCRRFRELGAEIRTRPPAMSSVLIKIIKSRGLGVEQRVQLDAGRVSRKEK